MKAALAAALVVLAVVPAAADSKTRAPSRLLVESREFNLVLSRPSVKPGTTIVQLVNRGEDPHDLRIARAGRIAETLPGELGEWEGRLRRGRYRLWCTLEGHRALGMKATLRVR